MAIYKIIIFLTITLVLNCQSESKEPFIELLALGKQLHVSQQINQHWQISKNLTFNTTKEKYLYIYFPLLEKCIEGIGQDFEPLLDSLGPAGIGAASFGVFGALFTALKAGLFKLGLFGLLKTSIAGMFGLSALPITIGVGTAAYLIEKYGQDQLKRKCGRSIELINIIITREEVFILNQIKEQQENIEMRLNFFSDYQNYLKQRLRKYKEKVDLIGPRLKMLTKFFTTFKKIMKY